MNNFFRNIDRRQQLLLTLLAALCLLFLSAPLSFVHGSLQAEEGSTYLRYARSVSGFRAIVSPHQGYYSFVPNLMAVVAARILPISLAPWLAVCTALGIRLLTAYVVATSDAFRQGWMGTVAALISVTVPGSATSSGTIHSQFYLGLAAAIILVSGTADRHAFLRTTTLLLAGLSGTVACMLMPFFVVKAWRQKDRAAWLQAAIISVCTVLQLIAVKVSFGYTRRANLELQAAWVYIDSLFNHVIVLPFGTRLAYHHLSTALTVAGTALGVLVALLAVVVLWGLGRVIWRGGVRARVLAAAGMLTAVCAVLTMDGGRTIVGGGDRYFLVCNACLQLALLLTIARSGTARSRRLAVSLVTLSLVSGVLDVARYWDYAQQAPLHWEAQIAQWRAHPSTLLHNGPPGWEEHAYPFPQQPLNEPLPFYVFDSNTRLGNAIH